MFLRPIYIRHSQVLGCPLNAISWLVQADTLSWLKVVYPVIYPTTDLLRRLGLLKQESQSSLSHKCLECGKIPAQILDVSEELTVMFSCIVVIQNVNIPAYSYNYSKYKSVESKD